MAGIKVWYDRAGDYLEVIFEDVPASMTIIKRILEEDSRHKPSHGDIEPLLVFDDEHRSYQLTYVGWDRHRRVHGSIYHLRICNNKIYIEEDTINRPIADLLLEAGVPREDIVLAFHAPRKRQYTDFAVA